MAHTDLTSDFRALYAQKRNAIPENKRRKLSRPKPPPDEPALKGFVQEAYVILKHIATLQRMLATVRKPYLDVHARAPGFSRTPARTVDFTTDADKAWEGIKYLTPEERDQIDVQARVILSRCADRVKEMEILEQRRAELAVSHSNPLAKLLPARLLPPDEGTLSAAARAAHNASITWYLGRRLAAASEAQRMMQEERMRRQLERTRTLGSGAAREAAHIAAGTAGGRDSPASTGSWLDAATSTLVGSIPGMGLGAENTHSGYPTPAYSPSDLGSEDDDDELELSQSQILQFEQENAAILRDAQDTLAAVQQAESRILEISALQTELLTHLQTQTAVTEQLFEDAIAATGQMEKGNVQLREAKRRAKDSRLFLLVFLLGASLSLLFLHYY